MKNCSGCGIACFIRFSADKQASTPDNGSDHGPEWDHDTQRDSKPVYDQRLSFNRSILFSAGGMYCLSALGQIRTGYALRSYHCTNF